MKPVTTENIFELLDGCFTSAALGAALELGLFWLLDEKPLTVPEISQNLTIPLNRCTVLLQMLCGLGLLDDTADGYIVSALARKTILNAHSRETWAFLAREVRFRLPAVLDLSLNISKPISTWETHKKNLAMKTTNRRNLFILVFALLVVMLGFGMIIPVFPFLIDKLGASGSALGILAAALAYLPGHPEFSIFNTYLSDIGDTPGWPQIILNSGTFISVPIRYLVLALRLMQLGAGRNFALSVLTIGFVSTAGTALMTATPFSLAPTVHKTGIGLYFLGVVVLQSVIFIREWSLKIIPRVLPLLSLAMIIFYFVFVTLMVLYEQGSASRTAPVIWEWLSFSTSILWMLAQSILLGRKEITYRQ